MSGDSGRYVRDLIVSCATGAVMLAGVKTDFINVSNDASRLIMDQNSELRASLINSKAGEQASADLLTELRVRVARQEAQIIKLNLLVETQTGSPRENLYRYLDALGVPAWAKEYDPDTGDFVMLHITTEYESAYGISQKRYEGKTDYQIHAKDIADRYRENDLETLEYKTSRRFKEEIYDFVKGKRDLKQFLKFHLELTDGTEIIAGLQITP